MSAHALDRSTPAEMRPPPAGQLLTAEQLAERWQVPVGHVYRLVRARQVPVVKFGRYYRFRLDQIEAWELEGK